MRVDCQRVICLWLIRKESYYYKIFEQKHTNFSKEKKITEGFSEFDWSRRLLALSLSDYFKEPPDKIPVMAPRGTFPSLKKGWGYVSVSHTVDALFLAWSIKPIGIDLERIDRSINAYSIARRFYTSQDQMAISNLKSKALDEAVLSQWVAKEAAIKWQRGSLAADLSEWSCSQSMKYARHQSLNLQVPILRLFFGNWILAIASEEVANDYKPFICFG